MSTNQKQKDKMASWRKDLPYLPESLREEESDGNSSSSDVSQAFSKRPASFDSYSPDNDKETDSSESDTGVSEHSEVCSSRKKKRKGRRSVWEERHVNDLVDVICSSEYYKKISRTRKIRRMQKYMAMCSKNWARDMKMLASHSA